jgi:hypothetical protein
MHLDCSGKEINVFESNRSVTFSFLCSGPRFSFDLADEFEGLAELSSPVDNGVGGRSFDFLPSTIDPGISDGSSLVETLVGRDSHQLEVYERPDEPILWWLRWPLRSGSLYSHLREEDGLEMAGVEAANLSIVDDGVTEGLPYLLLDGPLALAVSSRTGYQDHASFFRSGGPDGWMISFHRPSFVPAGTIVTTGFDGGVMVRGGTQFGVEVDVTGEDGASSEDLVRSIVGSLSDA